MLSSTAFACDVAKSARPAPDTPDFASTTTVAGSTTSAIGASASSTAVAVQPGLAISVPVGGASSGSV